MTVIVVWGILVMNESAAIPGFPRRVFLWTFTLDKCLLEDCMAMLQAHICTLLEKYLSESFS